MRPEITSEFGTLEEVLVHSPGGEHLRMIPWEGDHPLFSSKTPSVEALRADHGQLKDRLAGVAGAAGVMEVTDLLREVLEAADRPAREAILEEIVGSRAGRYVESLEAAGERLEDREAGELVADLVEGWPRRLVPGIDGRLPPLVLTPLRSLMWMRDSAFVTPSGAVIGSMSAGHRQGEPGLVRAVLRHHPRFDDDAVLLDLLEVAREAREGAPTGLLDPVYLEGGNVLVLDGSTLAVGVGAAGLHYARKTTRSAFLLLAKALFTARPVRVERLYLVHMPDLAGFIHLDTLLSLVAPRTAVAMPYLLGAPEPAGGPAPGEVAVGYVAWLREALLDRSADLRRIPTREQLALAGRCEVFERGAPAADGTPRPLPGEPRPLLEQLADDGFVDLDRTAWVGGAPGDHPSPYEHLHAALYEQRNQAGNLLTLAPGRAVAFDRNPLTLAAADRVADVARVASNEIRTGGGGPHCLALPLRRRRPAGGAP